MVRLLDACVQTLSTQGKRRMYIDAVKGGESGFQAMGSYQSLPLFSFPTENFVAYKQY